MYWRLITLSPGVKGEETNTETFRYYIDTAMTEKQPKMVRLRSVCDKHRFIEEPCEVKVSSTVLKTSGYREELAEFNNNRFDRLTQQGETDHQTL